MGSFEVPADFRAFMRAVVRQLDLPPDQRFYDDDEAFQHECGYGGRVEGAFVFTYITPDGHNRWELALHESQIREIADGVLTEVEGLRDDMVRTVQRKARGLPLLIWGEYRDDALRAEDLAHALDLLQASGPRMVRLWSVGDDQCAAMVRGDACAIYVIESYDGYGTTVGGGLGFTLNDHDGREFAVPGADCVAWATAREALLHFATNGTLGIPVEGRIPSGLLMLGDADRTAVIAQRGEPPASVAASSLARLSDPFSDWAVGLVNGLVQLGLLVVSQEISEPLASLLQFHGLEAEQQPAMADWLCAQLAAMRGVARFAATGSDLQVALRRARARVPALERDL